ncbi:hypothetical protein Tco_0065248 [Tanacetum coccineum]
MCLLKKLLHTDPPTLISRVDSLELDLKQTKLTMGNAIVKLVKKVKKLEGFLKRRNLVLTDSEDEEPKAQGRKILLVRKSDKETESSYADVKETPKVKGTNFTRRSNHAEAIRLDSLQKERRLSKIHLDAF